MKKSLQILALLFCIIISAQAPEKFSYQAIIRNASNALITNAPVGVKISILKTSAAGTVVYAETQTPTTNANGLISIQIGAGTVISGTIAGINWGTDSYYIKTETDPGGGTAYSIAGTTQLLSVPYALYARNSGGGGATGSGTLDFVPKWTPDGATLGNSNLFDDGTNLGISTITPTYKLDILHSGGLGIRNRSSASYSVIDIDAANGDAALRFQNAGVTKWNVRNEPTTNDYQIFRNNVSPAKFTIKNADGFVGINESDPSYQLDVVHSGQTGIRSRSTANYSVIDIDAANGDAALRFANAGVRKWTIRNSPGSSNLEIYGNNNSSLFVDINNTTGKMTVYKDFTALGIKAFTMDYPLDPTNKTLMHAAIESNEVLNSYSGNVVTDASGKATVSLPEYFEAINKDFRYQLTVIGGTFAQAMISKEVSNNKFEIATNQPNVKISWEVKGVRNDKRMQQNPFKAVEEKTAAEKGKYLDPKSWGASESKGVSYDANLNSSLSDIKVSADKKATPVVTTGSSLD